MGEHITAEMADRGRRLFEFLAAVQRVSAHPVMDVSRYGDRDGRVLWLGKVPEDPATQAAQRLESPDPGEPVMRVRRIPAVPAPAAPTELQRWLAGDLEDPEVEPELLESIQGVTELGDDDEPRTLLLLEDDAALEAMDTWLPRWREWALAERDSRRVRDLYGALFSIATDVGTRSEELELVVGVGLLTWAQGAGGAVRRHLLTSPAAVTLDGETGELSVTAAPTVATLALEDEMLDPATAPKDALELLRGEARDLEAHPLDRRAVGELLHRLANGLGSDAEYLDVDEPPQSTSTPTIRFAPALILRRRSPRGLAQVFAGIADQIEQSGQVPSGLLPLLDPNYTPVVSAAAGEGAIVDVDGEEFLPRPLNAKQLQILHRVDSQAQTLVQGPPGTGKTHSAAALITHLLAQGKRVLVTAKTDRALKEVREKLPPSIRELAVAVVGADREDLASLEVAVRAISTRSHDHDPGEAAAAITEALAEIDRLRREKAVLNHKLLDARAAETIPRTHAGQEGTLARLAEDYQQGSDTHGWLSELTSVAAQAPTPVTGPQAVHWLSLLRDRDLAGDEGEAAQRSVDLEAMLDPAVFGACLDEIARTSRAAADQQPVIDHVAFAAMRALNPDDRRAMQMRIGEVATLATELETHVTPWTREALAAIRTGRGDLWRARERTVASLVEATAAAASTAGPTAHVHVPAGADMGALAALAEHLLAHIEAGNPVKTNPDGSVKHNWVTPKPVKAARPLLDSVRVNNRAPVTVDALRAVIALVEATGHLDTLDRAWPASAAVPVEDTVHERLAWHATELEQLRRLLAFEELLTAIDADLREAGMPGPAWDDLDAVITYGKLVDAAETQDAHELAATPVERARTTLEAAAAWADAADHVHALLAAVRAGDRDAYAAAHRRAVRLVEVRALARQRDDLTHALTHAAPTLARAVLDAPDDPVWGERLALLDEAWTWARTGTWLRQQDSADANIVQQQIAAVESALRAEVDTLAATRAWMHALSPTRLTGQDRANLTQYAQLVRRLGKGTGKYGDLRRAAVRASMARCRPAVPVWILPLYRIAEQLVVSENMFDVVVIDEASQAGLEGTFLQYLAPRIVVIGDDKQVSPAAVGIDQQTLRDLAERYIPDDQYKESWLDPKRSLFDEAVMRFGARIVLTEHRRCVPEIIGFSNQIAYEPQGIRLEPVRQYGADRLEPIKVVHVVDGYEKGQNNKVNIPEAEAIVEQVRKCLTDPHYDGRTIGVISLQGPQQAQIIRNLLLAAVEPEEWKARELRCGDAADFQGSERDVVFLSMVSAPEAGQRVYPLTQEMYVQRYNVAASRAKDQLWIFHSVHRGQLTNTEDLRHRLLEYAYAVAARDTNDDDLGAVPDDVRVEPFDSLFEQRVYNRIRERGYTVTPQFAALGYRIDLVVVGARGNLAVECDGDAWHGPDRYVADLGRQRELERCGWQFFRIPESMYYIDPAAALAGLWATLDELEIRPAGWVDETLEDDGHQEDLDPEPAMGLAASIYPPPAAPKPHYAPAQPEPNAPVDAGHLRERGEPEPAGEGARAPAQPPRVEHASRWLEGSQVPARLVETPVQRAAAPALDLGLAPYIAFDGSLPPALDATSRTLRSGIALIVRAEGPVLGARIHAAYVAASGGHRVGRAIAHQLNGALSGALRNGELIADNPLGGAGVKPKTFRLPDQPGVAPRQLGPRSLDQVPPAELAHYLVLAAAKHGWDSEEALFRDVLTRLGRSRLTTSAVSTLSSALPLARESHRERA